MSKLIYLATPYNHSDPAIREQRFVLACLAAGTLMREGVCMISSIPKAGSNSAVNIAGRISNPSPAKIPNISNGSCERYISDEDREVIRAALRFRKRGRE